MKLYSIVNKTFQRLSMSQQRFLFPAWHLYDRWRSGPLVTPALISINYLFIDIFLNLLMLDSCFSTLSDAILVGPQYCTVTAGITVLVDLPSCPITGVGESSCGDEFFPESSVCTGESFPESAQPWSGDSTADIGWPGHNTQHGIFTADNQYVYTFTSNSRPQHEG